MPIRPYLDSSVYIAHIKDESGRGDSSLILGAAQQGRLVIVASTFVLVEVIKSNRSGHGTYLDEEEERRIDQLLSQECIEMWEVDQQIARIARRLRRVHSLRGPDAVHLATAIRAKADVCFAWDGDYPVGLVVEGVEVMKPYFVGQAELGL